MMNLIFPLAALGFAALLIGGQFLLKRYNKNITYMTKPLAVLLFVVSFFRYLYKRPAIYDLMGLKDTLSPFNVDGVNALQTALAVILVWFSTVVSIPSGSTISTG